MNISTIALIFGLLSIPLSLFIPFFYLIGLTLGIISLIKSKKDKKIKKGFAITAIVIGLIFLILQIAGAIYVFKIRSDFDSLKQSITIENNAGYDENRLKDVKDFILYTLDKSGYTEAKIGKRDNNYLIKFNDYDKNEILNVLNSNSFEAKIGDVIIFNSADSISWVCRDTECSGIDPMIGCTSINEETYNCHYRFAIEFTDEIAQKIADTTSQLDIIEENGNEYLSESFIFYINGEKIDELMIGSEIKGMKTPNIQISGSGNGTTQDGAIMNSLKQMKYQQLLFSLGGIPEGINLE